MPTIEDSLRSASAYLSSYGVEGPRADAELLMSAVLGLPRERLIANAKTLMDERPRLQFNRFIARRGEKREPVAYIVGHCEFYGVELYVSPSVLIPRPETELLVERAIAVIGGRPARVADLGTGSGAIAVAIAAHSSAVVIGTDISARAVQIARSNAVDRVAFRVGDLLAPLEGDRFDLVVSNPPYVATADLDGLPPEVKHEPREALDGGADGLAVVRRIAAAAKAFLEPGGRVLVEIGAGQAERAKEIFYQAGFAGVTSLKDLAGIERVIDAC